LWLCLVRHIARKAMDRLRLQRTVVEPTTRSKANAAVKPGAAGFACVAGK
jgi:hypothetical protein